MEARLHTMSVPVETIELLSRHHVLGQFYRVYKTTGEFVRDEVVLLNGISVPYTGDPEAFLAACLLVHDLPGRIR